MISKNVELLPPRKLSAWRKISLGTWRPNGDSQVYCELRLNAEPAMKRIKEMNQTSAHKVTMTHFLGKVMGRVLKEVPDLNAIVRCGNIYPRRDVDIFFHVVYEETELSGQVIRQIDSKSIEKIAEELSSGAKAIRSDQDLNFKKIKNSWDMIPSFMARWMLNIIGFVFYQLNLNIKSMGVPKDCFGSMMITNIGSLGFSQAFVPLSPYTHTPLVIALGKTEKHPVCDENGQIVVQEQVSLCFTFDHRIMDGARGAKMAKLIKHFFQNPELL